MTPLLQPDESISDGRVRLTIATPADLDGLPWVASALAPDWTLDDLSSRIEVGEGVRVADMDDATVGLMVVRREMPAAGTACVPFIAIDPARRYRGLGGCAGLAIEAHLRERFGVETVFAPIPDGRGLAVYFWLRLGFRPLTQSESPGELVGLTDMPPRGIWMARERA
jgi:hypothetical protein